jgi:hypothetical protein
VKTIQNSTRFLEDVLVGEEVWINPTAHSLHYHRESLYISFAVVSYRDKPSEDSEYWTKFPQMYSQVCRVRKTGKYEITLLEGELIPLSSNNLSRFETFWFWGIYYRVKTQK